MCCFSRPVERVSDTNIFARFSTGGRQFLVYSMAIKAKEELAMILPIPVAKGAGEQAVRFISLKDYANFFDDMRRGFPEPVTRRPPAAGATLAAPAPKLAVVTVGNFEASFVPTTADFSRLDERFRLPTETWQSLPKYSSYGFTVFKLKSGDAKVHPMAFEFPSAMPNRLFFPTVHIHDGKVHATAGFDHALYCQLAEGQSGAGGWRESPQPAGMFLDLKKSAGLVDGNAHCYQQRMRGRLKNDDVLV